MQQNAYIARLKNLSCSNQSDGKLCVFGGLYSRGSGILARGAGGPEFALRMLPVRLTSPSLARRWYLLNDMYNVMWHPAWLPCS